MSESNSINETPLDSKIQMILNQTTYTQEEATTKLELFNNDPIKVIKNYLGIPEKKTEQKIKSINQEIYKQIREKIDTSEYRKKHPIDINQVINNFTESEMNKNKKNNI